MKFKKLLIILAAFATGFSTAHAAISAYEGFEYDTSSAVLQGQSGGSGWSNAWATGNPSGDFSYNIIPGLSFGSLFVNGGALDGSYSNGGNEHASRLLASPPSDGSEKFVSFLAKLGSRNNPSSQGVAVGKEGANPGGGDTQYGVIVDPYTFGETPYGRATAGNTTGDTAGGVTDIGTVYLHLFRMTTGTTSQTIDYWVLTEAQFSNFKDGGLTVAELNAAGTGSGASEVFQRRTGVTRNDTLLTTNYVTFRTYAEGAGTQAVYDELRYGDTLDDVTPLTAAPLAISNQPANQTVGLNGSAALTVGASGPGPISYQWQVSTGGGFTDLSEGSPYTGVTGSTLTINPVTENEAASYRVIVSNTVDTLTSNEVTVSIAGPPPISIDLYPGITVDGVVGLKYLIEYSTNMVDWFTLQTINPLPSTPYLVIDTTPVSAGPKRFYRASLIP